MKIKLLKLIITFIFVILVSSTVVLAADITYDDTTYTEINEGSDLKITVSYKVNYYEEGEQATLLVLTGSDTVTYTDGVPNNIAYADQQVITGAEGSFTFVLEKSLIQNNRVYVKLGATSKDPADEVAAPVITDGAVTFEDANNIVKEYKSGYGGGYVAMGEDVVFVVDRGTLATNIRYRVYDSGSGEWGADILLTPDGSDQCTIPGSSITGNVQLVADRFAEGVTVQLITADNFKPNVSEVQGKQICAIFGTSAQDTYTVNGKEAFWSSKYNAHVVWIDSAETLTGLVDAVEVQVGVPATEIVYDGDINGNGRTTAADATIIKDCLHEKRKLATTDMQLFKLDVDANMQVTTADIVQILKIAVGK